jgi:hypothetical protein
MTPSFTLKTGLLPASRQRQSGMSTLDFVSSPVFPQT